MSQSDISHFSQSSPEHSLLKSNIFSDKVLKVLQDNGSTTTPFDPNIPDVDIEEPICQTILYDDIGGSRYSSWLMRPQIKKKRLSMLNLHYVCTCKKCI